MKVAVSIHTWRTACFTQVSDCIVLVNAWSSLVVSLVWSSTLPYFLAKWPWPGMNNKKRLDIDKVVSKKRPREGEENQGRSMNSGFPQSWSFVSLGNKSKNKRLSLNLPVVMDKPTVSCKCMIVGSYAECMKVCTHITLHFSFCSVAKWSVTGH